ncbi:MAG: hypothetical protein K6T75_03950 [Acetobacteraceae bacterium]|nr:hypothetical protein [Acetobacteraceae bacterium]
MPLLVRTWWLERLARRVEAEVEGPVVIGTGKKASGTVHAGSLRELVIADALRRRLQEAARPAMVVCTIFSQSEFKRWRPGICPKARHVLAGAPAFAAARPPVAP